MADRDFSCIFVSPKCENMETKQLKPLPVGIQTFDKLIESGCIYVDKTAYIHKMVKLSNYIFLSRPRRFGKSLLVSTLQSYFEGRKELFKGLAMEQLEQEWTKYPVLRFDMSTAKHSNKEELELELSSKLSAYEAIYGKGFADEVKLNQRLQGLIERAYRQTGKQVVVLIDEYDAPLLDVVHEDEQLPALRQVMRNLYSPLKNCDPYLKFVFLTGITKFSQLSIFSELNNLTDISLDNDYAAICGITTEELLVQMSDYIDMLAMQEGASRDETVHRLKNMYDGYHFTWPSPDMLNPYSLLKAFNQKRVDSYWFASGTPTFFIELLRKYHVQPSDIADFESMAADFDTPVETMTTLVPLLYQSGYITIKDCNLKRRRYRLGIPNTEVRTGLMSSLIPYYISKDTICVNNTAEELAYRMGEDRIDDALTLLQSFLLTVPYCNNASSEGHYQQMLYVILSLVGQYHYIDVEVRTPTGRVDMVMRTDKALYLFELKLNKSAETAMKQIDLKDYPSRFARCGLPIVKVGINFEDERRTLSDWEIKPFEPNV